jgi:hypothetical protein
MLILSFLALIPRTLLGFVCVHRVWRSMEPRDLVIKVFLAGPAGLGLSSLAGFLWIWAKLDLGVYVALETSAALLLFLVFLWWEGAGFAGLLRTVRFSAGRVGLLWLGLLAAALLLYAAESWFDSLPYPHGGWDAWNHWNVVSRFMFRGGEHWTGTFLRTGDHPDYPLLVSISNAITWELLSRDTLRAPVVLAFFYTLCLAGLLFGLVHKLRDARQAALGTVVLLSHSYMAIWSMAQYVDMDLAFYFLASAGLMLVHLGSRQRDPALPVLAGLMAGLSAWTKNEGLTFALLSVPGWMLLGLQHKTAVRNFLAGLSLPLVVVGLFKIFLAPENDIFAGSRDLLALVLDPGRYLTILRVGAEIFVGMNGSPALILAALAVYALVLGKTRRAAPGWLQTVLIVIGQWAGYFTILLVTPYSPEWHVRSSIGRLYLHLMPLMLLCLFLWLKSPVELQSEGQG